MSVSLSQLMKAQVTEGMISCDTELDYCLLASQGRSQAGHYARLVLPTQPRLVQDGALTLRVSTILPSPPPMLAYTADKLHPVSSAHPLYLAQLVHGRFA